jgi:hypothetical protein
MKELIKQILKESTDDLDFLDNYWRDTKSRLESIISRISNELPVITTIKPEMVPDTKIKLINLTDIKNSWDANNLITGKSDSLVALADKIKHMIRTGKSDGIKRMVEKIATGRVKSLQKPSGQRYDDGEFLGRGHFRWNNRAYKLTTDEINRVKEYFKL